MERKLTPKTRDVDGQETGLWYCESSVLPYPSIRRIVIIGDKHVAAVIAAKQKNAHQSLVISCLRQRLQETKTLKSQDCCAKRGDGSTDKRSPCECHVTLSFCDCVGRGASSPRSPRLRRRRGASLTAPLPFTAALDTAAMSR